MCVWVCQVNTGRRHVTRGNGDSWHTGGCQSSWQGRARTCARREGIILHCVCSTSVKQHAGFYLLLAHQRPHFPLASSQTVKI